jgi:hypothetical protein
LVKEISTTRRRRRRRSSSSGGGRGNDLSKNPTSVIGVNLEIINRFPVETTSLRGTLLKCDSLERCTVAEVPGTPAITYITHFFGSENK